MGGDEFTIILTDFHHREAACGIAAQIIDIIRQPYRLADHAVQIVALVGMQDIVVVDTADVLLVTSKQHAQDVKGLVERMKGRGGKHLL